MFKCAIASETGAVAEHWVFEKALIDGERNIIEISYAGYLSKDMHAAGKAPVLRRSVVQELDAQVLETIEALMEPKIRAEAEFASAEDVAKP